MSEAELIIRCLSLRDRIRALEAELAEVKAQRDELVNALDLVMRPDGHYMACPCPGSYSHAHMPGSLDVQICAKLQAAIAKARQ